MAKYQWQTIPPGSSIAPVDQAGNTVNREVSQVMNVQKGCVLRTRANTDIKADVYIPEEYWDGNSLTKSDPDGKEPITEDERLKENKQFLEKI